MPDKPTWNEIERQLLRERKAALVELLHDLVQTSPDAQRFLSIRYGGKKPLTGRIKPYRRVIESQFTISEWSHTVSWNFAAVNKAVDDYTKSSRDDQEGVCELLVIALETAVSFADSINLQDDAFDDALAVLAERCVNVIETQEQFVATYARRLKAVNRKGSSIGFYGMSDELDRLYPLQM